MFITTATSMFHDKMNTQSIHDSLISRAKVAPQVLLPRATFTVLGGIFTIPDPTPNPTPDPDKSPPKDGGGLKNNGGGKVIPTGKSLPAVASTTSTSTTVAGAISTTATAASATPTTTTIPSVIIASVLPPHRTTLSASIVTNPASNTRIDSPTPSSTFLTSLDATTTTFDATNTTFDASTTTFDASTLTSAPSESSGGVTVGSAQSKGVPIGVIAGASIATAVVILVASGLFCIWGRLRRKNTQVVANPSDQFLASMNVFSNSNTVEEIVTMERINDGSTILHSRSNDDTYHEGPNLREVSPSLDAPGPWQGQRGNHLQTEAQPPWDNDAHILSPASIHKSVISANEVAIPGALSVSRAETIQGIDEQMLQLSSDLPVMAGTAFHQVYREVAMLRREIDELRRSGVDVPPAYPGNMNSSQ